MRHLRCKDERLDWVVNDDEVKEMDVKELKKQDKMKEKHDK